MKIKVNGVEYTLTPAELEEAFREKQLEYLKNDAEAQLRDYLFRVYDDNPTCEELVAFVMAKENKTEDEIFGTLARKFEKREDCETDENSVWEGVVSEFANAEIAKSNSLMVEGHIKIGDDLMFDDEGGYINAYVETWFDVDARFGTKTFGKDDYINVYANYFPESGTLTVSYVIKYGKGNDSDEVFVNDLTQEERDCILRLMNEKCRKENNGEDMNEAWNSQINQ
jgi:hypothetical protein